MLIAATLMAMVAPPPPVEADEIVVTAARRKCHVRLADRILSDSEFSAHAEEWAKGKPVRVAAPDSASYKCLAKIAFRLSEKGVRLIEFVDRETASPNAR